MNFPPLTHESLQNMSENSYISREYPHTSRIFDDRITASVPLLGQQPQNWEVPVDVNNIRPNRTSGIGTHNDRDKQTQTEGGSEMRFIDSSVIDEILSFLKNLIEKLSEGPELPIFIPPKADDLNVEKEISKIFPAFTFSKRD